MTLEVKRIWDGKAPHSLKWGVSVRFHRVSQVSPSKINARASSMLQSYEPDYLAWRNYVEFTGVREPKVAKIEKGDSGLQKLPLEILLEVLRPFSPHELTGLRLVSKYFNEVARHDALWKGKVGFSYVELHPLFHKCGEINFCIAGHMSSREKVKGITHTGNSNLKNHPIELSEKQSLALQYAIAAQIAYYKSSHKPTSELSSKALSMLTLTAVVLNRYSYWLFTEPLVSNNKRYSLILWDVWNGKMPSLPSLSSSVRENLIQYLLDETLKKDWSRDRFFFEAAKELKKLGPRLCPVLLERQFDHCLYRLEDNENIEMANYTDALKYTLNIADQLVKWGVSPPRKRLNRLLLKDIKGSMHCTEYLRKWGAAPSADELNAVWREILLELYTDYSTESSRAASSYFFDWRSECITSKVELLESLGAVPDAAFLSDLLSQVLNKIKAVDNHAFDSKIRFAGALLGGGAVPKQNALNSCLMAILDRQDFSSKAILEAAKSLSRLGATVERSVLKEKIKQAILSHQVELKHNLRDFLVFTMQFRV